MKNKIIAAFVVLALATAIGACAQAQDDEDDAFMHWISNVTYAVLDISKKVKRLEERVRILEEAQPPKPGVSPDKQDVTG